MCELTAEGLAESRARLHKAITCVMDYRQHAIGCGINQTDFCGCGLREAIDTLDAEWKGLFAAYDQIVLDSEDYLNRANEEIARRERAQIAYTQSEQKRLVLLDKLEAAESALAVLTQREQQIKALIARWRSSADAIIEDVNNGQAPVNEADLVRGWEHCADDLAQALAENENHHV